MDHLLGKQCDRWRKASGLHPVLDSFQPKRNYKIELRLEAAWIKAQARGLAPAGLSTKVKEE